jgi:hypothetical protein
VVLKKASAVVLAAITLSLAMPAAASAQATSPPHPDAVESALLAFDLYHYKVEYDIASSHGSDGAVVVTLFGPPEPEMPDQIFRVVWSTEPLRFSDVVVRWTGGEQRRSYAELAATLGPRPAGFDQLNVAAVMLGSLAWFSFDIDLDPLIHTITTWLKIIGIGLGALIVLWVAVGLFRRHRPNAPMPS